MDAQVILGVLLVIIGIVILYFSAVGIAFFWILKQMRVFIEKDTKNNARKP